MSDHGSDNDNHNGQNKNMGDLNDMHVDIFQITGAMWIPPITRTVVFHLTGIML